MIRNVAPVLCAVALTGCAGSGPTGVWLIEIGQFTQGEPTITITHNYLGAAPEADEPTDDPWTTTGVEERSNQLMFAEVYEYAGETNEYVLVADGMAMLGARQEDKTYLFTWTNFEHEGETDTHEAGYSFTTDGRVDIVWSVALDFDKDLGTGTFGADVTAAQRFDETDVWNPTDVGLFFGQTPAESYLDATTEGEFIQNAADQTDCSATPCNITITQLLSIEGPVTATRTSVLPGDFEGVTGAGQPEGIPEDFFGEVN